MPAMALNALLAAVNATGRHLSKGTGIGIIVLVAVLALVVVAAVCALAVWLLRGPVSRRSHKRGQVGRV